MYGTVFRMRVKSGQEEQVRQVFEDWERERKPHVRGAIGGLLMKPEGKANELLGVAIFQDKAAYMANADNPDQHQWFTKLRELLDADPEWEDGEYISGSLG